MKKKKLKIVLISNTYSPSPILLIIHEMVKQKGHDSYYIHIPIYKHDLPSKHYDDIDNQIKEIYHDADLIAFTCMTNTFLACVKFIQRIRKRCNKIPIAMGGIHSTAKPLECLSYTDYACIGEGEKAFIDLIDSISEGKDTQNIPGFYVKKNRKIIKNPQGDLIKDLDSLPIPSFDLKDQYFVFKGRLLCMDDYKNNMEMLQQYYTRYYFIVTSRGCPYTCKFCVNDVLKRLNPQYRLIRKRSNNHIIEELKRMKAVIKYPLTIGFADDDFFSQSSEQMKDFSERYRKEINIPFFCSSTPHSMQEDKMKYAVEAGLHRLEIGIQSINDKTNWEIHGRAGLRKDIERAIKIVSPYRNKVQLNYDIILDNPWEPEESVLETLYFMSKIPKPCTFAIFSLIPFPGTSQYERAKREGKLKDQEKIIYNNDIMLLKNNQLNTLMTLYGKYHIPFPIIKLGIKVRNLRPFSTLLKKSTVTLWRAYAYYEGLKTSIEDKNYVAVKSYIRAPIRKFGEVARNSARYLLVPLKKENLFLTTETLMENKTELDLLKKEKSAFTKGEPITQAQAK